MNISLPEGRKAFVDEHVQADGCANSSEYVRELIRLEKDRRQFREHLLTGLRSGSAGPMDADYFATLRQVVAKPARQGAA